MNWKRAESTISPSPVDMTSAPGQVYVRKNITKETREDSEGNKTTYFTYDEAVTDAEGYEEYAAEQQKALKEQTEAMDDSIASLLLTQAEMQETQEAQDETLANILLNQSEEENNEQNV